MTQNEQYEILLIDDEKEDIKAAKSKGLSAINFNIKDDVPILINELVKLKIINEDDRNLYLKMIKGGNDD